MDLSGSYHLKTVLFRVELNIGASRVTVGEKIQERHHCLSNIFVFFDIQELLISESPCLLVFIKSKFSSCFSWNFLLDEIVIVFNLFL